MTVANDTIIWAKVKPNAIIPTRRNNDAGYDIYACIENDIIIEPHKTVLIPTGIASAFSSDWYLQLQERGSTGVKGMGQRCGVIDSSFRGEWFAPITNHNNDTAIVLKTEDWLDEKEEFHKLTRMYGTDLIIYPTTKAIAQAVILPVPKLNHIEMTYQELLMIESERGLGCLGSSGR